LNRKIRRNMIDSTVLAIDIGDIDFIRANGFATAKIFTMFCKVSKNNSITYSIMLDT